MPQPPRAYLPYPTMPTHAMAPPTTSWVPPSARFPTQSWYSPSPPPPQSTPPRRALETIDLYEDIPPPPPPRPGYSSYPFHPSIMDETGLFSKELHRIIGWFATDVSGRDLSRRFQGIVNPETVTSLDMTNDRVIFAEIIRSGFAVLPYWALPVHQPGREDQPSMPLRDKQTPIRVAVLLQLLPGHCLAKKAHEQNAIVTVPTIDNSQICRPATDLKATDLLRVFVYELTESGQSKVTALAVRNQLHLLFSCRRELLTSSTTNPTWRRHATGRWRTVVGDQLEDRCESIIGVLNPLRQEPISSCPLQPSLRYPGRPQQAAAQ